MKQHVWAGGQPGVVLASDVADLSPPSSPRLRQTTFGATLDFIEALCDASSGLTSFAPVCSPPSLTMLWLVRLSRPGEMCQ